MEYHENFVEIRQQLDTRRERVSVKFDNIYIEMAEKTKTFEAVYKENV
jgi:hypothetical protein